MSKKLLTISLLMLSLALAGCGGNQPSWMPQIIIGKDAQLILTEEAGFDLGVWVTKHHPERVELMAELAGYLEEADKEGAGDLSTALKASLLGMCAESEVDRARMDRVLRLIDIDVELGEDQTEKLETVILCLRAAGTGLKQALELP